MKFTFNWLKEFLETDLSLGDIVENLTSLGLEVESVSDRRDEFKNFTIGYIKEAKKHPEAEKLQICTVFDGKKDHQIVCGAHNARVGIKIILAYPGAIIPDGKFEIKISKIRNIESHGMICSEKELLISNEHDGIIELPITAETGGCFLSYFGLDDPIIELSITPNRSDCLGVYGIARDLAARKLGKLKNISLPNFDEKFQNSISLKNQSTNNDCTYFSVREIRDLINKDSPLWLKNYLKNIGMEPVSSVVDITNYINLSFNRPLHAYDRKKIGSKIFISYENSEKKFPALNGKEYSISTQDLIIKDESNFCAIAGVIGSENTKTDDSTRHIALEAGIFSPESVSKSGRFHNINTDSRYRFERGVDSEFTKLAADYAANLILSICGGEVSNLVEIGTTEHEKKIIDFPYDKFEKITGIELSSDTIEDILSRLGFEFVRSQNSYKISPPSWRHDITCSENISEEIIRIYGYHRLGSFPLHKISENIPNRIYTPAQRKRNDIKRIIASRGYNEVVTWSFMNSKNSEYFGNFNSELKLLNPISSELDYMRPSIIPNLLEAMQKNIARSQEDLAFFELGPIFNNSSENGEEESLAAAICGSKSEKIFGNDFRDIDIYDIKGDLEILFNELSFDFSRVSLDFDQKPSYYHPKRSATIKIGKNIIGYFGEIHPKILKLYDIPKRVCSFEIFSNNIPTPRNKYGKKSELNLSQFQSVSRDFAFLMDSDVKVGELVSLLSKSDKLIKNVSIFDIYSDAKIGEEKKSVAINILLQSEDSTLSDEQIKQVSDKVIKSVEEKFSAKLRDL